jgi:hypothetical protein
MRCEEDVGVEQVHEIEGDRNRPFESQIGPGHVMKCSLADQAGRVCSAMHLREWLKFLLRLLVPVNSTLVDVPSTQADTTSQRSESGAKARPLIMAVMDIDHFGGFNCAYDLPVGDAVL